MAPVEQHLGHTGGDSRSDPAAGRRHGQDDLAEVISIRPAGAHGPGLLGSLVTMARGLTSPRAQATSVRSTPHRPPSPAARPRPLPPRPSVPHDAA